MAYNQDYYQPQQRQYNGPAAQRPAPRGQGYPSQQQQYQPQPQQQYPPQQQYDQYPQDNYGYDSYNNGYAQQDYYDNSQYQDRHGGQGSGGYSGQDQGYQQDYYGNNGGGAPPRGMQPPSRGGRGGPMQRQPTAPGMTGNYDQRAPGPDGPPRGNPNGGGRGGRPPPLDRNAAANNGARQPLKTPPISPNHASWDNPFPSFPGAKKTPKSDEQRMVDGMASMDINSQRPKTAGSNRSPESTRYNGGGRGHGADDYGRPSENQQNMPPRGFAQQPQQPQQGYPDQARRGPPPSQGYSSPPQHTGYADAEFNDRGGYQRGPRPASPGGENFAPISRAMTMPNNPAMGMQNGGRAPPLPMDAPGPGAPHNNSLATRNMPPRPSTTTGTRPPPQRIYPDQAPPAPQNYPAHQPLNRSSSDNYSTDRVSSYQGDDSINEFYDSYYDNRSSQQSGYGESAPQQQPGPNNYPQVKGMKSQPDMRARAQPQAAVFEMADNVPPIPSNYPQKSYLDNAYGSQTANNNDQGVPGAQAGPSGRGYDGYNDYGSQNGPQRSGGPGSMNSGPLPGPGGLPSGPASNRGFNGLPNGPSPQPGVISRANTMASQGSGSSQSSHPTPVRPGLASNTPPNQPNNRPPPIRNYNNAGSNSNPQAPPQPTGPPRPAVEARSVTHEELEELRNQMRMNPNDQAVQLLFARKLIEASDVLVASLPDQRARNKARERYVLDAHKLLKKLVAAQNPDAMFFLADCYGRGALGLEADNKEAFTLYQSAAKAGHAAAAYRTAVCCELGNDEGGGTRKDPLKAIQWYKRAAVLGDTPAMYKMGMILLKGLLGQQRNPREAVGWLKRAAERADAENPHALHELGLLYEQAQDNDSSILRDEAYALQLFSQAADLGYKFSQFRLGCCYEYGLLGCPIDPRQSIMWYSKAAVQEEHQSELALSGWYLTGSDGVLQQSDTEAYLWARKAALAGLAKAEYAMGYFTEVGIGSPANLEDAKRWYWRAAAQNFPKARERLEDLKKGGAKAGRARERISRSKQNEGECAVM
ncbi:hypothetical protein F5884DRAFT_854804 [Xylogone sp. PMI_703]|nr:hypothetical protein F5884DRAFT_854804 [Xylogone sp. PMI_703]